ncbi:MAG: polyphosphate kinase 1 [Candidatus Sericytochromatia bacterium]|nr:polyphosphate kinase 1 [Candidatus Tanganyikabacteria bacterium]
MPSDAFINQELSWLDFNQRVLEEALDRHSPLLERLKFLAIFSTNLDEFFMIRVSGLQQQLASGLAVLSPDGMSPGAQLAAIRQKILPLLDRHMRCLTQEILPALAAKGVRICPLGELAPQQRQQLDAYFHREIFPVLTPLAVDPSHPFPVISNLSLNLAVLVEPPGGGLAFARVKVPPTLPRFVPVGDGHEFVLLEELIAANAASLFPEVQIHEVHPFRVTRNADLEIEEDEAVDLLKAVEREVRKRRFGRATRLEVTVAMPQPVRDLLTQALELDANDVYEVAPPLGVGDFMTLTRVPLPDLHDPPLIPTLPAVLRHEDDLFAIIREQDVLLHHPYESFEPVVDFIWQAAEDPSVLAIKQTLYRTSGDSPFIAALSEAAERGKQVAALVELKARFDEENNILWAKQLERVGVHVSYGLLGLKTHGKVALVVRREHDGIRRYVHLATGNYNPATAKVYTDLGLFTCRPEFGEDASELFNYLTGFSQQREYRRLLVAPINLRRELVDIIRGEGAKGKEGRLIVKANALTDTELIRELYAAGKRGAHVDLIIRGMCCLRPGVPGYSDNIRVSSIVGRFLEHSRIIVAGRGIDSQVWIGSADPMPRNLDHRVEVVFPVVDPALRARIVEEIVEVYLGDVAKARVLGPDGSWTRRAAPDGAIAFEAQAALADRARAQVQIVPPPELPTLSRRIPRPRAKKKKGKRHQV